MKLPYRAEDQQLRAVFEMIEREWPVSWTGSLRIFGGEGSPEGVVTATKGALYLRSDGGAGSCMYVKESDSTNTGWVAK